MSMNELETEGIVIASREYRERDLLVTLLTPSGRHPLHRCLRLYQMKALRPAFPLSQNARHTHLLYSPFR